MQITHSIGRAIFGAFFLYNGYHHLIETESLAQYASAKGVTQPKLAVRLSGALLAASGASMLFGVKPQLGAAGAVLFLAPVSMKMHDFWNQRDPGARQNETIHFAKNVALLGAAVALAGLDERRSFASEAPSNSQVRIPAGEISLT